MLSVLDIFRIGIGPSSSHTVGPIRIGARFIKRLEHQKIFANTASIKVQLLGSLALTGAGHATPKAVILGLLGKQVETLDPSEAEASVARVYDSKTLRLGGTHDIRFCPDNDIIFDYETPSDIHPNGMILTAYSAQGEALSTQTYFSTGGGFIASKAQLLKPLDNDVVPSSAIVPFPFSSAEDLLALCKEHGMSIAQIIYANEDAMRPRHETDAALDKIVSVMMACIDRGLKTCGVLPGGLKVKRRAPKLWEQLNMNAAPNEREVLFDWLNVYAMAVNEENAAGGQVVTAPTNGAAGILPSVLRHYCQSKDAGESSPDAARGFLLTAGGIGLLYLPVTGNPNSHPCCRQ
jgi:L-serine dehydratase